MRQPFPGIAVHGAANNLACCCQCQCGDLVLCAFQRTLPLSFDLLLCLCHHGIRLLLCLRRDLVALCTSRLLCRCNQLLCLIPGTLKRCLILALELLCLLCALLCLIQICLHHLCPLLQHGIDSSEEKFFQKEKQHEDIDDRKHDRPNIKI